MNRLIGKYQKGFNKIAKKAWKNKISRRICFGSSLIIIGLAVLFFSFNLYYQDKIFPRTYLGGLNFGAMTREQANESLNKLVSKSQNQKINYSFEQKKYSAIIDDFELNYQNSTNETISDLFAVGRTGAPGRVLLETLRSIVSSNTTRAHFSVNETKINDYLMTIAKDVDKPEKDATIEIRSDQPVVVKEEIGRRFEIIQNKQIIFAQIGNFNFPSNLPFKISIVLPKIDEKIAAAAIPETKALMQRQLVMKADSKTFELHPDDIAQMIEFVARPAKNDILKTPQFSISPYVLSPEISSEKVYPRVEKIAEEIYQEPKDPKFEAQNGRVKAFQIAQTGYELEKEKAVLQIIEAIKTDKSSLDLPVKVTESAISSDDPEKIGLKELVAEGTTNFSGSPQNRRHNIAVGANSFDGVLIKPGEEFSMLKYLGPVEASTGYLPELVIKEDRTIPEYGGGLCQVSTTMFRAALNAGLKITERQNHSYRVRYYEPPVGMDATIYIPKPDFKFVNDYENYLLIQTVISGDDLTFRFYGTKDGRRSETTTPYVYDVTGSGEPIYTESPDLAPGEIKRIETAHPGSKASFKYSVFDASGKLMHEETFNSSYVPWPARYLYGPGTTIPPAEE